MAEQVAYSAGNDFIGRRAESGVSIRIAQTFTPDTTFDITSVSLLLGRRATYSGTCSISFYTTDESGFPDSFLGSVGFSGSTLSGSIWTQYSAQSTTATSITSSGLAASYPNDYELMGYTLLVADSSYYYGLAYITDYVGATGTAIFSDGLDTGNNPRSGAQNFYMCNDAPPVVSWKEVNKTGLTFNSGTKYAIVFSGGATNTSTFPYWAIDYDGGYSGGNALRSIDGGSTWSNLSGDFLFKINGDESGTPPTKATNPSPADANTDVTLDQATISWTAGDDATSHDVYYGTESGNLTLVSDGQEETSFTITGIDDGSPWLD